MEIGRILKFRIGNFFQETTTCDVEVQRRTWFWRWRKVFCCQGDRAPQLWVAQDPLSQTLGRSDRACRAGGCRQWDWSWALRACAARWLRRVCVRDVGGVSAWRLRNEFRQFSLDDVFVLALAPSWSTLAGTVSSQSGARRNHDDESFAVRNRRSRQPHHWRQYFRRVGSDSRPN